jgi:aspartyl-tRNA(Asn)/glutamyl-tRNA(Gln) amidotransferase subunit B
MSYEVTIGLEAHVQLSTRSKAFCGDRNAFGAEPNHHVSPLSLGYPGTLPWLNEEQVRAAVRLGLALDCRINRRSTFDRKNYCYADLPKGYQITQDERPICSGGRLPIRTRQGQRDVRIHHIHMEEDAGKSIHQEGQSSSLVDLNRAGTPLLEIVTEPDLHSGPEVDAFMSELRRLVRYLGISDGNMEEGSLRCDVNISVRPEGQTDLGTRCEIKNMNSMRFARRAIDYEVRRQIAVLEGGGRVVQQTRQYDPVTDRTTALREKEDAHDYRYFPDPDLPPVVLADAFIDDERSALGRLPWEAFGELTAGGVDTKDAALLTEDPAHYARYRTYVSATSHTGLLTKLWINRILPFLTDIAPARRRPDGIAGFPPERMHALLQLIADGTVAPAQAASRLLPDLLARPGDPRERAEQLGLIQNRDTDYLKSLAKEVIATYPQKVRAYRRGKKGLLGFFMGEVMRRSNGSAAPRETQTLLRELLD